MWAANLALHFKKQGLGVRQKCFQDKKKNQTAYSRESHIFVGVRSERYLSWVLMKTLLSGTVDTIDSVHIINSTAYDLQHTPMWRTGCHSSIEKKQLIKETNIVQVHSAPCSDLIQGWNPHLEKWFSKTMYIRIFCQQEKKKPWIHLENIYSSPSQWGYNGKQERDMVFSHKVVNLVVEVTDRHQRITKIK